MTALKIAVIGCGIVARARYVPALHAMGDLFEVRALCDTAPDALAYAHAQFPRADTYADHTDMLSTQAHELDGVILLTGGDHAPLLASLADRRLPTLVEKPLAYTRAAAIRAARAFADSGTLLQVGYMKRHYPALARLQDVVGAHAVSTVAVELIHPPEDTYLTPVIGRGRAVTSDLPSFLDAEAARPDVDQTLANLGVPPSDIATRRAYILLATSVIHDINLLRALLGAPDAVPFAHFWNAGLSGHAVFVWGGERAAGLTYTYVDTGGYSEAITMVAPEGRWALHLPSPYLPHAAAVLTTVHGASTGLPITTSDPVSLDDPFHRQLRDFHRNITSGRNPLADGSDAAADLDLVEQVITATTRQEARIGAVQQPAHRRLLTEVDS